PFEDPYLLKLMYGQFLSECHAEHLLAESGITRSAKEEIEARRATTKSDRAIYFEADLYDQIGNLDDVFEMSSHCVPETVRTKCLGKIVPE
ncbi:MAG: hypothetical protein AAFN91_07310, partial [Pseudomonadota bacterium]